MTPQQRYTKLNQVGDVELRHYPRSVLAQVEVSGPADTAGNRAFRSLVSYIGGQNKKKESLAMTAPVIQEEAPEKRSKNDAKTAARASSDADHADGPTSGDSWWVSFVLPGDGDLKDYPDPSDPKVRLLDMPAHDAAAMRWSGRWRHATLVVKTTELDTVLARIGWQKSGSPRWARYDPPWKPAFLRRNEVIVPVVPLAL
jgi:hypothetical protein